MSEKKKPYKKPGMSPAPGRPASFSGNKSFGKLTKGGPKGLFALGQVAWEHGENAPQTKAARETIKRFWKAPTKFYRKPVGYTPPK